MNAKERSEKIREDYPLYQKAVTAYLEGDEKSFHRFKKSHLLSRAEQLLLETRARFVKSEWQEALALLKKTSTSSGSFLNAEKLFLQGSAHFFLGQIEEAALSNIEAHETYQSLKDSKGSFLSLHNLMVDFSRLGLQKLAARYFERASKLAQPGSQSLLIHRAMACEASRFGRYAEACNRIEEAMKHVDQLSLPDRHALIAVAADIFVRADKLDRAHELLIHESSVRSSEQGRIDFELGLVNVLREGLSLGRSPRSLSRFPEYELKWKLLLAMQSGDQPQIKKLWKNLVETFPALFEGQFQCLDASESKSAFWRYLRRLDQRNRPKTKLELKGKLALLLQVLQNSNTPLRKESLIELIWKVPYDPKLDSRLYKLIERAKRSGVSIMNISSAYTLRTC